MRVGIVTTWFERGAAVVSRQMADALSSQGARVFIYARGEKYAVGDPKWDQPNVHWGRRLHWPGSGKIDREDFLAWIAENQLDAIIFNEQTWWQPVIWAKSVGVKCGSYIDYYTEETVPLFSSYDFLICNTRRHLSALSWHEGASYLPWGTDTDTFKPEGSYPETFTFFHSCGWNGHRKGLDLLLDAFEEIVNVVDAKLVIHTQADLPHRAILSHDKVEVIKRSVSAPGLYHLGDVYVYPSRLEGIGLTICEALACGLPVITTDEPPMSEFVADGRDGFLVPVKARYRRKDGYYWRISEVCPRNLARAMLRAYEIRGAQLTEMKANARRKAVNERNWERNATQLYGIVAENKKRTLSTEKVRQLRSYDYRGWRGKIDHLMRYAGTAKVVSLAFEHYRRWRQPEFFR